MRCHHLKINYTNFNCYPLPDSSVDLKDHQLTLIQLQMRPFCFTFKEYTANKMHNITHFQPQSPTQITSTLHQQQTFCPYTHLTLYTHI